MIYQIHLFVLFCFINFVTCYSKFTGIIFNQEPLFGLCSGIDGITYLPTVPSHYDINDPDVLYKNTIDIQGTKGTKGESGHVH